MPEPLARIDPGTLGERLTQTRARALALGALQPIATRETPIADGGVTFLVRQVDSLARKAAERGRQTGPRPDPRGQASPFLPPEPELTLGALSETHFAVLNKFNVLDSHLLIVTRALEHQETLLTLADMEALAFCLGELDGLGFYNGGALAGASQSHKHLQLVPLPLGSIGIGAGPSIPMEPLLETGAEEYQAALPFPHAFARLQTHGGTQGPDVPPMHSSSTGSTWTCSGGSGSDQFRGMAGPGNPAPTIFWSPGAGCWRSRGAPRLWTASR